MPKKSFTDEAQQHALSQLLHAFRQCDPHEVPTPLHLRATPILLLLAATPEEVSSRLAGQLHQDSWPWWREAIFSADRVDLIPVMAKLGHAWNATDAQESMGYHAPQCQMALLGALSPRQIRAHDQRSQDGTFLGLAVRQGLNSLAAILREIPNYNHSLSIDDALWHGMQHWSGFRGSGFTQEAHEHWATQEGNPHHAWPHRKAIVRLNRQRSISVLSTAWSMGLNRWLGLIINDRNHERSDPTSLVRWEEWLGKHVAHAAPWSAAFLVDQALPTLHQGTTTWSEKSSAVLKAARLLQPLWSREDPDHGWAHVVSLCWHTARYQPSAELLTQVAAQAGGSWPSATWHDMVKGWYDILIESASDAKLLQERDWLHLEAPVWRELPWIQEHDREAWSSTLDTLVELTHRRRNLPADALGRQAWVDTCHLQKSLLVTPAPVSAPRLRL